MNGWEMVARTVVHWEDLLKENDCSENGECLTVGFAGNAEMVGSFGKMKK